MKTIKKLTAAVIMSVLAFAMVACGGSSSKNVLPGTWVSTADNATQYTFNDNGTGSVTVGTGITLSLFYTTDGNKLSISMSYLGTEQKDEYTYSVKDKTLTLTNSSGTTEYKKN